MMKIDQLYPLKLGDIKEALKGNFLENAQEIPRVTNDATERIHQDPEYRGYTRFLDTEGTLGS